MTMAMSDRSEGRVPPNSIEAEEAVLSACMLDPDGAKGVVDEVRGVLEADACYSDANRHIMRAIFALHDEGRPYDTVGVFERLKAENRAAQVGGSQYLVRITQATPAILSPREHARTIQDAYRVRRTMNEARRIAAEGANLAGASRDDVQKYLIGAEQALADIAHEREQAKLRALSDVMAAVQQNVLLAHQQHSAVTGTPTGFAALDSMTTGSHDGDLTIIAARPSAGKSAFALSKARKEAENGFAVPFFSLEMPAEQLGMRLLSIESGIELSKLRSGKYSSGDWSAITNAIAALSKLPIYIDDTPAVTVFDVKARVRLLQREIDAGKHPLVTKGRLAPVKIDYLQLMGAMGKFYNREQEVSNNSRELKRAAKELKVPFDVLSQLNREPEKRSDHRPQLCDLRECLPVDEWIYTLEGPTQLRNKPTSVLSATMAGIERRASTFVTKRYNHIFEVVTQYGSFRATSRHLVLTGTGWKQVRDLDPRRDVIAAPQQIPHASRGSMPHARLLGWLLGNGGLSGTPSLIYRKELDAAVRKEVARFGVEVRPRKHQKSKNVVDAYLSNGVETGSIPNPLMVWIRELGLEGKTAHDKFIPERYLGSSDETHRELLRGLWESDGTVTGGCAKYDTVSELLARQVAWLLLTLGIRSTVRCHDGLWEVHASVVDNERMRSIVSAPHRFGRLSKPDPSLVDPSPQIFVELAAELGSGGRRIQRRLDGSHKMACKRDMKQMIDGNPLLASIAASPYMAMQGVGWARISSVRKLDGYVRVADLQVPGPNNFVAAGLVVHNSGAVEQDADNVLFLFRPGMYQKDEPDLQGFAEIIVAKQRNGPTGTVKLAFREKTTGFENLSKDEYNVYDPRDSREDWHGIPDGFDQP